MRRILFGFLLIMSGCLPSGDLLPDFAPFKKELSLDAKKKCVEENSALTLEQCDIKNCLASPLTLIAMQELLLVTKDVLNELGITWFLESGSAIAAERFRAHLPWDDDVDTGVLGHEITPDVLRKMRAAFNKRGFAFEPLFGDPLLRNAVGYQGLFQVAYSENRFYRLLLSENPLLNSDDLKNLWIRYSRASSMLPHLDVFIYEKKNDSEYSFQARHFAKTQLKNKLLPQDIILPTRKINVLGEEFNTMNDVQRFSKVSYNTDNIVYDFYVNRQHSKGCKTLSFKDIRKHPETLDFLLDYLEYVYQRPAAKNLGIKFDKETVRKIYFP
jgi:hypothetical protein